MVNIGGFQATLLILIFLVPVVLIATSNKVAGTTKLSWVVTSLFLSWLAYLVFLAKFSDGPATE